MPIEFPASFPESTMRKLLDKGEICMEGNLYVLIVAWKEDSQIYKAEFPNVRLHELDAKALSEAVGTPIPENHIHPPWRDGTIEIQQPVSPEVYIKTPGNLAGYDGTAFLADQVAAEVEIMETISKKPHPNICAYYGCIRNGDLIGGICLQKYKCTLKDAVWARIPADQCPPIDPEVIISGIKAGLNHIHSFGRVHDDINPNNIMLDKKGNPIIIDFDSCSVVGAPCRGGTPGWTKYPKVAAIESDLYGFELVAKFDRGEYDGKDFDLF